MIAPPIEQACLWLAQRPPTPHTPLAGDHEADIVVVGAGLTGWWTALCLRAIAPELSVAVVERGTAAHGASGRNAGMLAETIDHTHGLAIEHCGEAEARRLATLGRDNLAELAGFLARHGIDCDYETTGRMIVALDDSQLEALRRQAADAAPLGVTDYHLLDRDETQAELRSPLDRGGVLVPPGGVLDPVKLVDGLRRVALAQGVRRFEQSAVSRLEDRGSHVRVVTAAGTLRAPRVILALSAYTHHLLPRVLARFIPPYDYIVASEPLAPAQLAALGWRRRMGVTDARNFFLSYRLTRDQRVPWGTSEAAYYPGNRVGEAQDHAAAHYTALRGSFARHFPALAGLEFPYAWGGAICATTRLTPFFGAALGGKDALRPRLHGPRARQHAARGPHPRAPRARATARAARSRARATAAPALPARTAAAAGRRARDRGAAARRCRRAAEPAPARARATAHRVFELRSHKEKRPPVRAGARE